MKRAQHFLLTLVFFWALEIPAYAADSIYTIIIKDAEKNILETHRCFVEKDCSFTLEINNKLIDTNIVFEKTGFEMRFLNKGITLWLTPSGQNSINVMPDKFGNAQADIVLYAPLIDTDADNDSLLLNPVWKKSKTQLAQFKIEVKKE